MKWAAMTIETDLAGLGMITIIFDPDDRHKCPPAAYNLTPSFEKQPACLPAEAAVTSSAIRTNPAKPGSAVPILRAAEEEPDLLFKPLLAGLQPIQDTGEGGGCQFKEEKKAKIIKRL
jgi:hypothetical protein